MNQIERAVKLLDRPNKCMALAFEWGKSLIRLKITKKQYEVIIEIINIPLKSNICFNYIS
jgi:hypothetical protein